MGDAVFLPAGEDRFQPTELARGPWDAGAQHGGAAAALLARAVERLDGATPMAVVRLTYEFLRPVPLTPLTVRTALARPGRRVQLVTGSLSAGEQEVCRLTALRIRRDDVPAPAPPAVAPPRSPEETPQAPLPWRDVPPMFTGDAIEVRFATGAFAELGPAFAWFRLRVPLVAGEEPSPLQRLCAAGDFGNGIASAVSWATHLFINPDLTLYVERPPEGEWIGLDAQTRIPPLGAGLSDSVLFDARGRVGRALQSLYVAERDPGAGGIAASVSPSGGRDRRPAGDVT